MEKWMKLQEVADWLNARRKPEEPPIVMHDVIRLFNAGKLPVCFEYEGLLGVNDANQPWFENAENRLRFAPDRTFKFRGIVQNADSVDLRPEMVLTMKGEVEMQAFRTFKVNIREAWDAPPDDLLDGKEIRPFGPHGATATVDDVLVSFSDVAALVNKACAQAAPSDTAEESNQVKIAAETPVKISFDDCSANVESRPRERQTYLRALWISLDKPGNRAVWNAMRKQAGQEKSPVIAVIGNEEWTFRYNDGGTVPLLKKTFQNDMTVVRN